VVVKLKNPFILSIWLIVILYSRSTRNDRGIKASLGRYQSV